MGHQLGACASSGGVYNNYAIVKALTDCSSRRYVPGCPPSPDALIYGLLKLQEKVRNRKGNTKIIELRPREQVQV